MKTSRSPIFLRTKAGGLRKSVCSPKQDWALAQSACLDRCFVESPYELSPNRLTHPCLSKENTFSCRTSRFLPFFLFLMKCPFCVVILMEKQNYKCWLSVLLAGKILLNHNWADLQFSKSIVFLNNKHLWCNMLFGNVKRNMTYKRNS